VGTVEGLSGIFSVTVSPDGKNLYTASENDDAVAVFDRDSATGQLRFVEVQKNGVGTVTGLDGARSATVSPDGKHVYAAGSNDDAVAVFSVAAASPTSVPSTSQWGLIALAILMSTAIAWHFRRQPAPTP
jgi:6-phosphogluconolactonase (cycloisomerase 2 family)